MSRAADRSTRARGRPMSSLSSDNDDVDVSEDGSPSRFLKEKDHLQKDMVKRYSPKRYSMKSIVGLIWTIGFLNGVDSVFSLREWLNEIERRQETERRKAAKEELEALAEGIDTDVPVLQEAFEVRK